MEGLSNYNSASSAFAASAGEINSNLSQFRAHKDAVKSYNRGLVAAADEKLDLDTLKTVGQEFGVRQAKKMIGKYGSKFMDKTGLGDWDKRIGENVRKGIKSRLGIKDGGGETGNQNNSRSKESEDVEDNEGVNAGEGEDGGEIEMTDMAEPEEPMEMSDMVEVRGRAGATTGMEDEVATDYGERGLGNEVMSSEQMEQIQNQSGMRGEDIDAPERPGQVKPSTQGDEEEGQKEDAPETETKEGDTEDEDEGEEGEDLEDAGAEGLEEGAAEEGGDEVAGGILQGIGTALDATGFGAPIGMLANVVGGVLEGGALYEAGKSVVDWFEEDILGEKPKIHKQALPVQPPTLSQVGLVATPIEDTSMDLPSSTAAF